MTPTASQGELLDTLTQLVSKSVNLEDVYETASELIFRIPHVDMLMIYLVDEETNEAVLEAYRNVTLEYLRHASRIPYPKGITWKVIQSNRVLCVRDAQKDPNIGPAGRALGKHGMLGIPIAITSEGRASGVIWVWSDERHEFTDDEIKLISYVGSQIATAVAWAKIFRERRKRMEKTIKLLIEFIGFTEEDRLLLTKNQTFIDSWISDSMDEILGSLKGSTDLSGFLESKAGLEQVGAMRKFLSTLGSGSTIGDVWDEQWTQGLFALIGGFPFILNLSIVSRLQQSFLAACLKQFDAEKAERVYAAFKRATDIMAALHSDGYFDSYIEGVGITSGFDRALLHRMAKVGAQQISMKLS
ncbi:MAG: GAF domain-containing protein [Candidatus Methanosuratincola sp.]|jgi:putative methionine-R-sulfoxide reductase with GAF domain